MCRCLIEVFSSSGKVEHFTDVSDIRSAGWKDTWAFAGTQRELDELKAGYWLLYMSPEIKRALVCKLYALVRSRNTGADAAVPSEVGCYSIDSTAFIVFR